VIHNPGYIYFVGINKNYMKFNFEFNDSASLYIIVDTLERIGDWNGDIDSERSWFNLSASLYWYGCLFIAGALALVSTRR